MGYRQQFAVNVDDAPVHHSLRVIEYPHSGCLGGEPFHIGLGVAFLHSDEYEQSVPDGTDNVAVNRYGSLAYSLDNKSHIVTKLNKISYIYADNSPNDDMKAVKTFFALVMALSLTSCKSGDLSYRHYSIEFPEAPVTLFDNEDAGMQRLGYLNVIQESDTLYRMYYLALEKGVEVKDTRHCLCYAWSNDLVNWHRENPLGGSNVLMHNLVDQSVCYLEGDEYPYRLIANVDNERGKYDMCMWFSKDGINFTDRKLVLDDMNHDSQTVLIPEDGYLKMYLRYTVRLGPGNYKRLLAMRHLDYQGNPITEMEIITDEFLYNSAASKLDDDFDLLLPTYFNNAPGMGDACHLNAYIQHGLYSQPIECPLNDWIEEDEKWVSVGPGILHRDGKSYIVYNTYSNSHDAPGILPGSRYKLIEIKISSDNYGGR